MAYVSLIEVSSGRMAFCKGNTETNVTFTSERRWMEAWKPSGAATTGQAAPRRYELTSAPGGGREREDVPRTAIERELFRSLPKARDRRTVV